MIRVFSFQPEYFNNNGDQGNLELLRTLLRRQGSDYKFTAKLQDADFALFGDASIAAMEHFDAELRDLQEQLVARHDAGAPTLLVGSSYEFFAPMLGFTGNPRPRRSEFVISNGIFGYRNSDKDLPVFHRHEMFWGTQLFGPILAKNPILTAELLDALGYEARFTEDELNWISQLRAVASDE